MEMRRGDRLPFLDLDAVESRQNVAHSVCQAEKHPGNPLLPLGDLNEWDCVQARPWESRTVIYDEEDGIFKCWYAGTDLSTERWWATGYAVSEDGVIWTKPRLGLVEYRGSKDNNICLPGYGPVIKDDAEPDPGRRYKMVVRGPGAMKGARSAYSHDGIHWTETAPVTFTGWDGRITDMVALLRDEQEPDPDRRYKIVWQTHVPAEKPGPDTCRAKCLGGGPDIEHFTAAPHNPILSPNDGLEQENHFLMLFPWRGFYVMLYEYGWYMPNATGVFGSYCADIRLAVSRDGNHFDRVRPDQKVIPRGPRGAWDDGMLVISDKPVIRDDIFYLYYCGNGEDWTSWPRENQAEGFPYPSAGCMRLSRMGLATIPMDRLTCLETLDGETPGTVTTVPLELADRGAHLVLNMSRAQAGRSWVDASVLDAQGKAIPGFGLTDCRIAQKDGLAAPVRWAGGILAETGRSPVRLKFRLCGAARLHAFGLA